MRRAAAGEAPGATPWFNAYQREFMRMLAFGELETFDHPVACAFHLPPKLEGLQCDVHGTCFEDIQRCQCASRDCTPADKLSMPGAAARKHLLPPA